MAALRVFEHRRITAICGDDGRRHLQRFFDGVNLRGGVTQRRSGCEIERNRYGLQLPDVVDRGRACRPLNRHEARQGHQCTGTRSHVDATQSELILLGVWRNFHDDLVAVARQIDGGNLSFAKSAVKRRAHRVHAHAQVVGAITVDFELGLQGTLLRITGDIPEHGVAAQFILQFR